VPRRGENAIQRWLTSSCGTTRVIGVVADGGAEPALNRHEVRGTSRIEQRASFSRAVGGRKDPDRPPDYARTRRWRWAKRPRRSAQRLRHSSRKVPDAKGIDDYPHLSACSDALRSGGNLLHIGVSGTRSSAERVHRTQEHAGPSQGRHIVAEARSVRPVAFADHVRIGQRNRRGPIGTPAFGRATAPAVSDAILRTTSQTTGRTRGPARPTRPRTVRGSRRRPTRGDSPSPRRRRHRAEWPPGRRFLVVDDHEVVRRGLLTFLERTPKDELVGCVDHRGTGMSSHRSSPATNSACCIWLACGGQKGCTFVHPWISAVVRTAARCSPTGASGSTGRRARAGQRPPRAAARDCRRLHRLDRPRRPNWSATRRPSRRSTNKAGHSPGVALNDTRPRKENPRTSLALLLPWTSTDVGSRR
jgi:hypothetical protein